VSAGDDDARQVEAGVRILRGAGLSFRSDLVSGPGGRQILLADPPAT
jgi:hypothetical protein